MQRLPVQLKKRRAFTIVEILVVVAIVLVLLSIVVVAVGSATRTAQRANTSALMSSIKQALVHFENEVGYLPPVLDQRRNLAWEDLEPSPDYLDGRPNGPDPSNVTQYQVEVQQWFSITTLAEYLIGYGPENEDGHNGLGIRNPGPDGFWGASIDQNISGNVGDIGTFDYRQAFLNHDRSAPYRQGRVYGPYLQLRDDRLLGAIDPGVDPNDPNFRVYFPGDALPEGLVWDEMPKVITDYWGEPIRYYRKPHPTGAIQRSYRRVVQGPGGAPTLTPPTLADVYLLRPWETGRDDLDTRFSDQNPNIDDRTATAQLQAASFALFSSGPDRRFNWEMRIDPDEYNRDNIVELGP